MEALLDSGPIKDFRDGKWCCLLCQRQFNSDEKLAQHFARSALHQENYSKAIAAGRITPAPKPPAPQPPAPQPPAPQLAPVEKAPSPVFEAPGRLQASKAEAKPTEQTGGKEMSALEKMMMWENKMKKDAKEEDAGETQYRDRAEERRKVTGYQPSDVPVSRQRNGIDLGSHKQARDINNNCDWNCGECGRFNLARSVICQGCGHMVDKNTQYLSNKLDEMKKRRFSRAGLIEEDQQPPKHQAIGGDNVGHQMLQGMGWSGGGLGRGSSGRSEPVQAHYQADPHSRAAFNQ